MSITGLFLILFLFVHMLANSAYLFGPEAFDAVIEFMGSPFIVVMVPVLAAGFVIHIIYAAYLTRYNMKARGNQRYEVANATQGDSWASQNMFVLGIIIFGVLVFHLSHFWAKMQLPEFTGGHAENGNVLMEQTFGNIWITLVYLVWFAALWFHLTHGFWSALQTLGWSNKIWFERWKTIGNIYSTLVVLGFAAVVVIYFVKSLACGAC